MRVTVLGESGASRAVEEGVARLGHHVVGVGSADLSVLCGWSGERLPDGDVVANLGIAPFESTKDLIWERPEITWIAHPRELDDNSSVEDFVAPRVLVVGAPSADAAGRVLALYPHDDVPRVSTDITTADLVVDARNGFFGLRRHYAALLGELCDALGADLDEVAACLRQDPRLNDLRAHLPVERAEIEDSLERMAVAAEPGGGARTLLDAVNAPTRLRERAR